MKPEELMIGDILEYMGTIVKVYSIGAKICVKECFGKNTYIVNFDNLLRGLELTPKILERNGFHKSPYNDWTSDYVNLILAERAYGYYVQNTSIVLNCIHELQHALKLCGIDKEIEI